MRRLLHIAGHVLVLTARSSSIPAGAELVFDSAASAAALLRRYAGDQGNLLALRAFLAALETSTPIHRLGDAEVLSAVAAALAARRAGAFHRATPRLVSLGEPDEIQPDADVGSPPEARPVRTWIEIELVDLEGRPVQAARYWIRLTDGSIREGSLDERGRARFDDLDPGTCEIRWPDLDEEAVALATVDLAPPPPATQEVVDDPGALSPAALDAAAQARALEKAASSGAPFCEECDRRQRARERAAEAG